MTTLQKIIKYCAIAFAVFLIISIIGGITGAVAGVSFLWDDEDTVGEMQALAVTGEVRKMAIDLKSTQLEVRAGDRFSAASNYRDFKIDNSDGTLLIEEEHPGFRFGSGGRKLILTIPDNQEFDRVDISAGAGTVKIDTLSAEKLFLDLGAGEVNIEELTAKDSAKINGGAGELNIRGGELANLDFDMGVGEVNLKSRLSGDCDIDYGIGELNLTLLGSPEDYRITLDKGVGEATLDGKKMQDGEVYGSGDTRIDIDGGIGALHLTRVASSRVR